MTSMHPCKPSLDMTFVSNNNCPIIKKINKDSLSDIILNSPDFTIFAELLKRARFEDKFSDLTNEYTLFVPSNSVLEKKYSPLFFKSLNAVELINSSCLNKKIPFSSSRYFTLPTLNRSSPLIVQDGMINNISHVLKLLECKNGFLYVTDDFVI
jgi:hypothetical protein